MNPSTPLAITPYQSICLTTQLSSQCSLSTAATQMSGWGFFLLFLLIICLCFMRLSRKRYEQQTLGHHQQQIERLERIWKMTAHSDF